VPPLYRFEEKSANFYLFHLYFKYIMDTLILFFLSCQNSLEKWGWFHHNISPFSMQVPALYDFQEKSANFYQYLFTLSTKWIR
jgi:hypothetical protein